MNERKKRKAFFSSADMSVEVWDQASVQNHVLQVENQFFNLALSQQEVQINVRSTPKMCCFVCMLFCCKRITQIYLVFFFNKCDTMNLLK